MKVHGEKHIHFPKQIKLQLLWQQELINGHLGSMTMEEWYAILNTMLDGFRLAATDDNTKTLEEEKEREAIIQKALDLFAKYFFHLWW